MPLSETILISSMCCSGKISGQSLIHHSLYTLSYGKLVFLYLPKKIASVLQGSDKTIKYNFLAASISVHCR